MKILLTLAWRNLWRNKRRTLITISSVLFAVLLAIVFFAMEKGSYERMIDSMVTYSTGYIQVQDVLFEEEPSMDHSMHFGEDILAMLEKYDDQIDYHVPRIQNFALLATESVSRGAMVIGIDPEQEHKLNDLSKELISGEFIAEGDRAVLLADGLASILKAQVGDTLVMLGQGFQGATAAGMFPVKGIVKLRVPEMSSNTVYMPLEAAQWFYMAEDRLTSLIVMPHEPRHTARLAGEMQASLDDEWYRVLTWKEMLKDLLTLMEFDMAGTMMLMFILYIVIAFGLFGTILTMMIERQREFALLFSLGLKRSQLAFMCFMESLVLSVTGVLAGIVAAIPIVSWFYHHPIQLSGDMAETMIDYGFEPVLPFSTHPSVFYEQAVIVLVIAFLIGLYPVYKVFRINIMQAKK